MSALFRPNNHLGGLKAGGKVAQALHSAGRQLRRVMSHKGLSSGQFYPVFQFSDLRNYRAIVNFRARAKLFGLSDPFYRCHTAVSGSRTCIDRKSCVNFASYDYLGFNRHPATRAAAKAAIDQFGTSATASRIVAGERPVHRSLENGLAQFYGVEDAIAFVSGHATNVSTIATLMGPADLIVHDELVHNSVLTGAKLSQATCHSFRHNDLDALEKLLCEERAKHKHALLVVEGLYSMDGDIPDLPGLIELKRQYGAWLMVDEAHALGVLGATGRGSAEHHDIDPRQVDIWMGTLSKALASCGGYIAGKRELIELLKFNAASFVYSVGLSPPLAAVAKTSLDLLREEPERVRRLQENSRLLLNEARAAGLDTGRSEGYAVVSLMIGDIFKAGRLSERLLSRGVNALPIIYPAVPMRASRLRFFITCQHSWEEIKEAVRITREEIGLLNGLKIEAKAPSVHNVDHFRNRSVDHLGWPAD